MALALFALALTGCETTAEKSAKLERVAKLQARSRSRTEKGLSITRQSTKVLVGATTVLHSSEGTAAVVTLHNLSSTPLRDVPIEITVTDASGASVYTNATPGLATSLVSVPMLAAHGTSTWIDDQVAPSGTPAKVTAEVGEGEPVTGVLPSIAVAGAHLGDGEVEGSVVNRSHVSQRELVVYVIARRAGAIVAAGRAIIPEAQAGSSTHFQAFLIGDAKGATLELRAPPTSVG